MSEIIIKYEPTDFKVIKDKQGFKRLKKAEKYLEQSEQWIVCDYCDGNGLIDGKTCPFCNGLGDLKILEK